MKIWRSLVCVLAGGLLAAAAAAHPAPGSSVALDFREDGVAAELLLPLGELAIAFGAPLAPSNAAIAPQADALKAYVLKHLSATATDGRHWLLRVDQLDVRPALDKTAGQTTDLAVQLWLQPPPGAPVRRFRLDYDVIAAEVPNHTALISARSDWDHGVFSDRPELIDTIRFGHRWVLVDRVGGGAWQGFAGVLQLGMRHIAEGTDHLLFLLVLLLPAVLRADGRRWAGFIGNRASVRRLLWVTGAFTLGHSAALVAGTLGWVAPPTAVVETLIALSILVSAVHAARPLFAGREAVVAGAFGLVHGLAFASAIAALGLDGGHTALAILGFNLGIEAMQLAVLTVTVPWFVLLARSRWTRWYGAFRLAGAAFAGAAAIGWIGERAFGAANPMAGAVDSLAAHPWWGVGALAAAALLASRWVDRPGHPSPAFRQQPPERLDHPPTLQENR